MNANVNTSATLQPLSKKLLFMLALCAAVANLYYAQPLLAVIAQTFNAPTMVGSKVYWSDCRAVSLRMRSSLA